MKTRLSPRGLLLTLVLCASLFTTAAGLGGPPVQTTTPEERAQALLEQMAPEERIGQLFLVEFEGAQTSDDTPIYDLIINHHIGGVVLKAENDNFIGPDETLANAWNLIRELQRVERRSTQVQQVDPVSGEPYNPNYIPLFIAITQDGDGYPADQILGGLTPLPSPMAIGAAWDADLAFQAGEVLGQELNALGINMLLGPTLDVIENPRPGLTGDLGTSSFGGNPFWVGRLGSYTIAGLHQGSGNQLVVSPKHFPGHGGANQPPQDEILTVRKTLEQLRQVELRPYFAVTSQPASAGGSADALLLTHSKYQAFQGNVTTTTRPITFDPQALEQLLALPEFAAWYQDGGLIISDELGSRAVRRFYDPLESVFDARLVARDAFLAGNDLLLTGNFVSDQDPDNYTTIVQTLEFFTQKYREDVAFSQRIDRAVLRILTQKYQLYNLFLISSVIPPELDFETIGSASQVTFEIARRGATLLSPSPENLANVLPDPPAQGQRIITITDTYAAAQCSLCDAQPVIETDALRQAILRLYGSSGGGLVLPQHLTAYSYADLVTAMETDEPDDNPLLQNLRAAQWVVFLQQDIDLQARPSSDALGRLLLERPDLIQAKNVVVFSLNAPYFLDATEISKLTAYYGLYSKQPQYVEIAARLLFKELTTPGDPPVSIPGIGYVLSEALTPNPQQTIALSVQPTNGQLPGEDETTPEPAAEYRVGESILIETSPVLDQNGNPVPDNTTVHFSLITTTAEGATNQREINTFSRAGVGRANIILDTAGVTEIIATSGDPPATSDALQFDVLGLEGGTPPNANNPTPQDNAASTEEAAPDGGEQPGDLQREKTNLGDWLLTLLVTGFISLFAYQAGATAGQVRWGVRWMLTALIGGLVVNAYISFSLPGAANLLRDYQIWGVVGSAALGSLIGWLFGLIWRWLGK